MTAPLSNRSRRLGRAALFVALLTAVLGAKFVLIDRYGSDLPYWDQWDAEGARLFRPYIEGTLTAADLFAPHNEHRPLFTRLLALGLLEAGDRQWDGRIQMVANAFLHGAVALLLLGLAWRALPPLAALLFAVFIGIMFGSPVGWENTLVGFQSQFYFALLFTAAHAGATLLARPRSVVWWIAPLAGGAALFSMASGVLSPLAIVTAIGVRALRDRRFSQRDTYILTGNTVLILAGWLLRVDVPGHGALKAATPGVWLDAWLHQFSWPVVSLWFAPLALAPAAATALAYFRRRIDGPVALTLLAGGAWFWLQAAAIAYARGAEGHGYASRYTDMLVIGLVLSALSLAYLALHAAGNRARAGWLAFTAVFTGLATWGLSRQAEETQRNSLQVFPPVNEARVVTVRRYLARQDPAFFQKIPWDELPYPSAPYLAQLLDTPAIRALQPPSVRPPPVFAVNADATRGFVSYDPAGPAGPAPQELQAWWSTAGGEARFVATNFEVDLPRVSVFVATENAGPVDLRLVDAQGSIHRPLGPLASIGRWKRVNFPRVAGKCRLEVQTSGPGWFAFTQPVTQGSLSALALKSLQTAPLLAGASGAALLIAFLCLKEPRRRWGGPMPAPPGVSLRAGQKSSPGR